jgi:multiple sugar transport system permease protein
MSITGTLAGTSAVQAKAGTAGSVLSRRRWPAAYAFVLPAAVMFTAFILVPIGYAIDLSFKALRVSGGLIGRKHEVNVGLENYRDSLKDPELWHSLERMVIYGLIVVPIMLGLATLFALLLDVPRVRLQRVTRLAIFLPYAVPGVIAALLWGFMYLPSVSPLRDAATSVGLPAPNFFGGHSVFGSVANIAIWGGTGFNMVVLYTSLRALPAEIYDAARIDGCNEFQLAVHVKLPLLRPAIIMTTIFSLIATLQVFSEPATLAPLTNVIPSTWMPLMKVYRDAFVDNDIYSAAATSVILAAGALLISLVVLRFVQSRLFGEDS